MASVGHLAVGAAVGAPRWREMAFYSVLALLPDADVIGFKLGVSYGDPWGHRGATHSLVFALVLALVIAIPPGRRLRRFVCAALALASHGILDAMTTGGLGAALLWPMSDTRIFFAWRPIPVAPIGLPGAGFMLREALLFAPLWVYVVMRSRRAARTRRDAATRK